ncbi:MAG: hypothetical protein JW715_11460 [Sedimentisphaerales bacterium]|nr:hypothetical protein [Sedimentisphaerales bacterium]
MAIRKSKKNRKKRISFRSGVLSAKAKQKSGRLGRGLLRILKITSIALAMAALGILLIFAAKSVKSGKGPIVLVNTPEWVGSQLKEQILANSSGRNFLLDENAAAQVQKKLSSSAWLDEVSALTTKDSIEVRAKFRKPVAVINSGLSPFYVDAEQVVMDYVPMPHLPIVEIRGLSLVAQTPRFGQVWRRDDLNAAIMLINKINRRDQLDIPAKPLLREIAVIDVSNYNGNKNTSRPHIVFYTKDNTEIQWGAELGAWQKYLESTDEQKLAKLYNYYKEKGTLSGRVKFINLRDPRDNIPLPIDIN